MIQITGGKMASQAMDRRKRDAVKTNTSNPEDYENGKIRDKKQKKLNDFMNEE